LRPEDSPFLVIFQTIIGFNVSLNGSVRIDTISNPAGQLELAAA
jgi:hypothetical protein